MGRAADMYERAPNMLRHQFMARAPVSVANLARSRDVRHSSARLGDGDIIVRIDDLVFDRTHHLESPLVVGVARGCTQCGGHGDGLGVGRHDVDAEFGLELLERGLPPVQCLEKEEIAAAWVCAKVEGPLDAALDVAHEVGPASAFDELLERRAICTDETSK